MTNEKEDRNETELVRSQPIALSQVGTASLARRGMQDLLATEESAELWLKRGREFLAQHRYEEAVGCFERGLRLNPNHADLQCYLGFAYYKGEGVPQNHTQAVVWWRKAVEHGHGIAQYMLSIAYSKGEGVPQDHTQAIVWCRKAAEQGYAFAESDLGVFYYKGEGVPQDHTQALFWWRRAAKQGYAFAQYNLGVAYYKGVGVPQDHNLAAIWWRKAAEHGDEDARKALDSTLKDGPTIEHERTHAPWGGIFR